MRGEQGLTAAQVSKTEEGKCTLGSFYYYVKFYVPCYGTSIALIIIRVVICTCALEFRAIVSNRMTRGFVHLPYSRS